MTEPRDPIERIADALERLAPAVTPPVDWNESPAYVWDGERVRAVEWPDPLVEIRGIASPNATSLDVLRGIDEQKRAVVANLERFGRLMPCHDMLLWGARGMGKSSLVRAAAAEAHEVSGGEIALVEYLSPSLATLPQLIELLAAQHRGFILFLDDLGFGQDDMRENLMLRSLLDGGAVARPPNLLVAVTSNRRSIVAREADGANALHERDERDNALALADRFGLRLGFHPCDREAYLDMVRAYTDPLKLEVDEEDALAWSIARGNLSGRTAYQYVIDLMGRIFDSKCK
ncbi:DUF815 domain-containing protein [Erythrobacter sp. JK5]|uniref:DUF815 domain-containing protein n=1 Tax=Erythrobacter sp. JK5 TaxID=2829500 RepID=UPI001BADEC0D|nr:DUF815 domain-containing protein [Erythrobacter sp. JK5]QUL37292.1 DUF815 domain-containing protein [Erythrobacter sp. JK5]